MKAKLFYSSCLEQGSAEFTLVEGYTGQGVYFGRRFKASDQQREQYLEELAAKRLQPPSGTVFVTVLKPFVYGDVMNDNGSLAKVMVEAVFSHMEGDYHKRKAVPNEHLCYVGKDFAGRLDRLRPILNAFDRKIIRETLADAVLDNTGVGDRWLFDRWKLQTLRDQRARA